MDTFTQWVRIAAFLGFFLFLAYHVFKKQLRFLRLRSHRTVRSIIGKLRQRLACIELPRRRSICIWLGFAAIFWLTTFPPWMETYHPYARAPPRYLKLYHAPIFEPPATDFGESVDVDYPRMFTEILVAECFVLVLYLTWGRKPGPK